jgi:hypothetical protein
MGVWVVELDGWINGMMGGWDVVGIYEWMGSWVDSWVSWMDAWMDRMTDGWVCALLTEHMNG